MSETIALVAPPPATAQGAARPPRRRPRRPPQPPRRPPVTYAPLPPSRVLARSLFQMLALVLLAFVVNVGLLSHLQHLISQQLLYGQLREQLAEGTLPVSEGDIDDVLLADGVPVALIDIPQIGLHEVIVEGSDSSALMSGPGHRRDTVLPGQPGASVVLGRAAAYGGPFSRIQELPPGTEFTVITGQGEQRFRTIGVRYAGDPTPPRIQSGEARLVLQTARGPAYLPTGVIYLDAELVGDAQLRGARQTTAVSLPEADAALGVDTSRLWALVFALQFLVAIELAIVLTIPRIGARKAWIVFMPITFLAGLWVATQLVLLLPNLL